VSKDEQKRRFLERIDQSEKNWKYSPADAAQRALWDKYMGSYEEMLVQTSTDWAPWHVIPADHKWFTRLAVADTLVKVLRDMKLRYPRVAKSEKARFEEQKRRLQQE
jgi:polyphosphate kinase 2 (PPK2 family)